MDRFNALEPREQAVLVGGALLVLLIIGWSFIWAPLRDGAQALDETVAEKSRLVVDLHRAAGLGGGAGANRAAPSQSLLFLVDQTARPKGLSFTRTQPDGADAFTVSFQNARFDTLLEWLIELERMHGVRVESANISGTREPGLVDGQVRLDRS